MRILFAAGVETLITLLIFFLISGISAWLSKKQQAGQEEPQPPPQPRRPRPARPVRPGPTPAQPQAPPPRQTSWEEELRRLLQGESEEEPAAPPVITAPPPRQPPPVTRPTAAPPPLPKRQPAPVLKSDDDMEKGLPVKLTGLKEAAASYLHASQLDKKVEAHMRGIEHRVVTHKTAPMVKVVAPELIQARALLRDQRSLRSAIIASVILGPPKAMQS